MKKQAGFTLIELIMVIVILGVLAATAIPKFIDLSDDAESAALQGVAGGIQSASAINYAAKMAGKTYSTTASTTCTSAVQSIMLDGTVPSGYSLGATSTAATTGVANDCTLTQTKSGKTTNVKVISVK